MIDTRMLMTRLWLTAFGFVLVLCACAGPGTSSDQQPTSESTLTTALQEVDSGLDVGSRWDGFELWALVDGNDVDADRINLVFAPWGWPEQEAFVSFVSSVLSWDGDAYLVDAAGEITSEPGEAIDAGIGLFGIEPWRSARDRFNVWYTTREPETPVSWIAQEEPPFSVPDMAVVTVALDAFRFNQELTSVSGMDVAFEGPDTPRRPSTRIPFANSVLVLESAYPSAGIPDLAHELGHALFNLADEYVGEVYGFDGRSDLSSWPTCAEDVEEAEAWWGDVEGAVDPMV